MSLWETLWRDIYVMALFCFYRIPDPESVKPEDWYVFLCHLLTAYWGVHNRILVEY